MGASYTYYNLSMLLFHSCPTLLDSPPLGFSRQEHWSGLPFPSPVRESEKWKWSRSVESDSSRPHGQQPTRTLCPWDFPRKSTGVGRHCLLHNLSILLYDASVHGVLRSLRLRFLICKTGLKNTFYHVGLLGDTKWDGECKVLSTGPGMCDTVNGCSISWGRYFFFNWGIGKDPDAGKDWRQEEKGTTEDEMVGWHHQLDGRGFEQALAVANGQGSLVCCSPWGLKESDATEGPNWNWCKCIYMFLVTGEYPCYLKI